MNDRGTIQQAHEPVQIWLASKSPRRRKLLDEAGYRFAVVDSGVDDGVLRPGLSDPAGWVMSLAYLKAAGALGHLEPGSGGVVLGADTVCVQDGELIGQPTDASDAERIIRGFVGVEHEVLTGVALICPETDKRAMFCDSARVRWGRLSDEQIAEYIAGGQWQGKAGAYNLEERLDAGWDITYDGDPTAIVGLPMGCLRRCLDGFRAEG